MRFIRRLLLSLGFVFVIGGLWLRHNEVLDWLATRSYQPPAVVEQLATDTTMTPYAKRLFYVNHPAVEAKQAFNGHCTDPSEQVAVLGCFTGDRMGIYLYDVTDERLQGIEQVTAAHEMLHQAYERLKKSEKTRINGLLQAYHDLSASQELKDKIASYKASEPTELQNEMHSIFGTEADNLPVELETYYQQYFTNRKHVLDFYHKYQSEFEQRRAQIVDFDSQLEALKAQIDAKKSDLASRATTLEQRRAQMDSYLAANNVSAYNAAVPGYNALVGQYREVLNDANALVNDFNSLLERRNQLAVQERELEDAIDSTIKPQ